MPERECFDQVIHLQESTMRGRYHHVSWGVTSPRRLECLTWSFNHTKILGRRIPMLFICSPMTVSFGPFHRNYKAPDLHIFGSTVFHFTKLWAVSVRLVR
jgi:hypothetical protein